MGITELFEKIEPQTLGQERVKKALASDKDLIGIFGPTGTGKSLLAVSYALSSVAKGKYARAIISRPVVDVVTGKEFTLMSNPEVYRTIAGEYLKDILSEFADFNEVEKLMNAGKLVLADPHFLRGRTFDNSIIIVDDSQSVTPEAIIEIITRLGRDSKLVIAGDPVFQRTSEFDGDGAILARDILIGEESAEVIDLGIKDIVRPGAKRGVKLLLELQMRKRTLSNTEKAVLESIKVRAPDADIITVVDLQEAKRKWNIASEHTPDVLIVVKEGHLGRLIGTGGERIQNVEEDTGVKVRAIQHTLDFKEYIRAIHPVSWVHKHVKDVDFIGPQLRVEISVEAIGPMLGQRGTHIKFLDDVLRKLLGVGVYAIEIKEPESRKRKRKK